MRSIIVLFFRMQTIKQLKQYNIINVSRYKYKYAFISTDGVSDHQD